MSKLKGSRRGSLFSYFTPSHYTHYTMQGKEGLNKSAAESRSAESREQATTLHFRILFSPHETEKEFWTSEELAEELTKVDVWFPESVGWTQESEDQFNQFATGDYIVPPLENAPVLKAEVTALTEVGRSGKRIAVGFIDVPDHHPLLSRFQKSADFGRAAVIAFVQGQVDQALQDIKSDTQKQSSLENLREKWMFDHIRPKIADLLQAYPHLQEALDAKGKLDVLITLGTAHGGIFDTLQKEDVDAEQKAKGLSRESTGPFYEMLQIYRLKQNPSDELAARTLLLLTLSQIQQIESRQQAGIKRLEVANKIASALQLEDIRKISLGLASGVPIDTILRQFGVQLPHTDEEADLFLHPSS